MAVAVGMLVIRAAAPAFCAGQASESPIELVRRTVQREIAPGNSSAKAIYTDRKETQHRSQTELVVETKQGTAEILVNLNGKALSPQQQQTEDTRLSELANNPEALRKKQKSDREDSERTTRIMKALPDAFLYEPEGTEVGSQEMGRAGAPLVRLKFRPNPQYTPPSHVEEVLTTMQGYILIDAEQHRVAKIDGTLSKDVGFGWGILGRLDRGGHFLVQQAEVIKGDWEITRMTLTFKGKELLFKRISIESDEVFSNFRPAPANFTFAQGVELLKKQEAQLAENRQQPEGDKSK
jgi:hypothetical protein